MREWRRLLTKNGYLVLSEMAWLQPDPPKEVMEFMENGYPEIKTAEENLEIAKSCGYLVIDSFVLPSKSWWDNYYTPIEEASVSQGEIQRRQGVLAFCGFHRDRD